MDRPGDRTYCTTPNTGPQLPLEAISRTLQDYLPLGHLGMIMHDDNNKLVGNRTTVNMT